MDEIIEYKVVRGGAFDFEDKINSLISKGYQIYGFLHVDFATSMPYTQSMVKYKRVYSCSCKWH